MRLRATLKKQPALRLLEWALLAAGVASLGAFAFLQIEQVRGQAQLEAAFEARRSAPKAQPTLPPVATPKGPAKQPELQTPARPLAEPSVEALGRLRSERIGLDVMIAEGVDATTLRRAAGRIPGTADIDAGGNVGLAAHRDTFFRPLRNIREGDQLTLETIDGNRAYEVEWIAVVEPDNVAMIADTSGDDALTLVTCFPFDYVGPAPRRFIVRAGRIEPGNLARTH